MTEGLLYFFAKPDPNRPIEEKYITEIDGNRKGFVNQENALLYLFDNGVRSYKYLTKEIAEYIDISKVKTFELWQIKNRVGYVLNDYEPYINENGEVKKRKAYVWRFIGFGRSCFSKTKNELKEKVLAQIIEDSEDKEGRGYNIYPFYSRHYR